MFKVIFVKYVFDSEGEDPNARFAVLVREESLPFAPVPGHEIQWPLLKNQRVISSTWNCERQSFTCRVENEYTVNLDPDAFDFDESVADAPDSGWAVEQIFPVKA